MRASITLSELDEGIEKSVENASRCLSDALFLFQRERFQASILLSMLSYEESGKTLLLIHYKARKKEITKTQWVKRFCSHTVKNIASRVAIWQDLGFTSHLPDFERTLARFDQEWKHVWTYVDYDFRNRKWTTPLAPKSFRMKNAESFCINALSHAREALESVMKKANKSRL